MPAALPELTPQESQALLAQDRETRLLDVREAWELERVQLPNAMHIPMGEIPARLAELNPAHIWVVLCHHGNRSRQVAGFLRSRGYDRVFNLKGGIDAWAADLNPDLARY